MNEVGRLRRKMGDEGERAHEQTALSTLAKVLPCVHAAF